METTSRIERYVLRNRVFDHWIRSVIDTRLGDGGPDTALHATAVKASIFFLSDLFGRMAPPEWEATPVVRGESWIDLPMVLTGRLLLLGMGRESQSILDAGLFMFPSLQTGDVLTLPRDLSHRTVVICTPILTDSVQAAEAIARAKECGASRPVFAAWLKTSRALTELGDAHPDVRIYIGTDLQRNDDTVERFADELIRRLRGGGGNDAEGGK